MKITKGQLKQFIRESLVTEDDEEIMRLSPAIPGDPPPGWKDTEPHKTSDKERKFLDAFRKIAGTPKQVRALTRAWRQEDDIDYDTWERIEGFTCWLLDKHPELKQLAGTGREAQIYAIGELGWDWDKLYNKVIGKTDEEKEEALDDAVYEIFGGFHSEDRVVKLMKKWIAEKGVTRTADTNEYNLNDDFSKWVITKHPKFKRLAKAAKKSDESLEFIVSAALSEDFYSYLDDVLPKKKKKKQ